MRMDNSMRKKIGAQIRKERRSRFIKQATLGKKVNLSASEISRIENGKRETSLATLMAIADCIGISISILLED